MLKTRRRPTSLLARFLGYTYKRRAETWEYLTRHCASEFTRENYDVLTHNCNHFSEKLHMFLRNEHIPDEVLKQPDMVMQTITARALRPLLNRWLGGFESKDGRSTDGGEAARALWDSLSPGALVEFVHEDSGRPLVGKVLSLRDNSAAQVASLNLLQQSMVQQEVLRTSITKVLRSAPKPIPRTREATTGPACCPSICQLD